MTLDFDKALAGTCSIALNATLFAWLLLQAAPLPIADDGPAMSVVWIARERHDDRVVPPASAKREVPTRTSRRTPSRTAAATVPEVQIADPAPVRTTEDVWSHRPPSSGQDRAETGFVRNDRGGGHAFRTGPDDALDVTPRVTFTMRDSSLMGRINRMGQANVCGELRAALRAASGGDAGVIAQTMRDRGCRI